MSSNTMISSVVISKNRILASSIHIYFVRIKLYKYLLGLSRVGLQTTELILIGHSLLRSLRLRIKFKLYIIDVLYSEAEQTAITLQSVAVASRNIKIDKYQRPKDATESSLYIYYLKIH